MTTDAEGVPLSRVAAKPDLSFTSVRWVTEIPDPDNEHSVEAVEMFSVVGEQYRLPNIEAAAAAIAGESSFLPPRFWLVPDDGNQHDNLAVAVYSTVAERGYHVGFLPKRQARDFRANMAALEIPGGVLEVIGCITNNQASPHPNVRLYMPVDFVELVRSGYTANPANQVHWMADPSPVVPRSLEKGIPESFSFDELCKIYCWHARKRGWYCFPDSCESKAEGLRSAGIGLPKEAFHPFTLQQGSETPPKDSATSVATGPAQASPRDRSREWFFQAGGKQVGPLDAVALKQAANTGSIGPNDSVRRGDMDQWVPAHRVKGLFGDAAARSADPPRQQGSRAGSLDLPGLLYESGDLVPPWSIGEFQSRPPKMFDGLPPPDSCGCYSILLNGAASGTATLFAFQDSEIAKQHFATIERKFSAAAEGKALKSQVGLIARLGQRARFFYMRAEMPPELKMPALEATEIVFCRDTRVIHINMVGAQPEDALDYATKIDGRLIS